MECVGRLSFEVVRKCTTGHLFYVLQGWNETLIGGEESKSAGELPEAAPLGTSLQELWGQLPVVWGHLALVKP